MFSLPNIPQTSERYAPFGCLTTCASTTPSQSSRSAAVVPGDQLATLPASTRDEVGSKSENPRTTNDCSSGRPKPHLAVSADRVCQQKSCVMTGLLSPAQYSAGAEPPHPMQRRTDMFSTGACRIWHVICCSASLAVHALQVATDVSCGSGAVEPQNRATSAAAQLPLFGKSEIEPML